MLHHTPFGNRISKELMGVFYFILGYFCFIFPQMVELFAGLKMPQKTLQLIRECKCFLVTFSTLIPPFKRKPWPTLCNNEPSISTFDSTGNIWELKMFSLSHFQPCSQCGCDLKVRIFTGNQTHIKKGRNSFHRL